MGCEKLFVMCREFFKDLFCIGRDAFYRILRESGLMLKLKKRHKTRTTDSTHKYPRYPNLIRGFVPEKINQLWVSDITYIWTDEGFCFLSLVTDAYSHKIVGWKLAPTLAYRHTEEALHGAIDSSTKPLRGLIHHSDRGVQYAYPAYTEVLKKEGILISMTENSDPLENAVAERINGILKQEWLYLHDFENIEAVRAVLEPAIGFYNTRRPHASNNFLTPQQAESKEGVLENRWKNRTWNGTGGYSPESNVLQANMI
jgi:transposase InsO family protein